MREKAILRRLVDAGTKIAQLGYAGEGDVDDTVDLAQQEVYAIGEKRTHEDYADLNSLMQSTLDEIEAISSNKGISSGVPTGFADLDELTNGFSGGQMIIVAARPAVGKSTLALDFCRAASVHNNLTSCIFSLEMSRSEIMMRLLSAEAKVALNHMRKGDMTDDDWNKLGAKMGQVSGAPMFIDDSPNMTMMEIRAKARRLKQRHDSPPELARPTSAVISVFARRSSARTMSWTLPAMSLNTADRDLSACMVLSRQRLDDRERASTKPITAAVRRAAPGRSWTICARRTARHSRRGRAPGASRCPPCPRRCWPRCAPSPGLLRPPATSHSNPLRSRIARSFSC